MPIPSPPAGSLNITQSCNCNGDGASGNGNGWHVAGCWLASLAAVVIALSWVLKHFCGHRLRRRPAAPILPTTTMTSTTSTDIARPAANANFARPAANANFARPAANANYAPPAPANFAPLVPANFAPPAPANFGPLVPANFAYLPPAVNNAPPAANYTYPAPAGNYAPPAAFPYPYGFPYQQNTYNIFESAPGDDGITAAIAANAAGLGCAIM